MWRQLPCAWALPGCTDGESRVSAGSSCLEGGSGESQKRQLGRQLKQQSSGGPGGVQRQRQEQR